MRKRGAVGEISVGQHHEGSFGVYMAHKIAKLREQFENEANVRLELTEREAGSEETRIFKGLSIFVNGCADPPVQEIRRLVCSHGGSFESYQTHRVTHIICDGLPDTKIKELRKKKKILPHVTPKWITDSVEQVSLSRNVSVCTRLHSMSHRESGCR
jgi:hypothetical protein